MYLLAYTRLPLLRKLHLQIVGGWGAASSRLAFAWVSEPLPNEPPFKASNFTALKSIDVSFAGIGKIFGVAALMQRLREAESMAIPIRLVPDNIDYCDGPEESQGN